MLSIEKKQILLASLVLSLVWLCLVCYAEAGTLGYAEYFIDSDPGQGNGIPLPAADGSFDAQLEQLLKTSIPSEGLNIGDHDINVRARDSYGVWGITRKITFKVVDSNPYKKITAAEYFIDTDPGQGRAIPLAAADGSWDESLEEALKNAVGTGSLVNGTHTLWVRYRDNCTTYAKFNGWGPAKSETFCVGDRPILLNPPLGVTTGSPSAMLKWTKIAGCNSYTVQVTDSAQFNKTYPVSSSEQDSLLITGLEKRTWYWWQVCAIFDCDKICSATPSNFYTPVQEVSEYENLPHAFQLLQNHPNPFNPSTEIVFSLPRPCYVTLTIYNVLGEKVRTLIAETLPAGHWSTSWEGTDDEGKEVSSGFYLYRLAAGDFVETKKMVLIK